MAKKVPAGRVAHRHCAFGLFPEESQRLAAFLAARAEFVHGPARLWAMPEFGTLITRLVLKLWA
jgi:hypothetical protein